MAKTVTRRIHILPDHVANQIAAGEVVERPSSVVKELVENSLDAGTTRVRVELRNGGKTLIRVADDGEGMSRPDALLALDRHATSKIRRAEDLLGVLSFGFRGEALPSIAAVSHFELTTAPADGGPGTDVKVNAGRILSSGEVARQPGTTVTVRALFHNVPARAKFLRSAAVETRAVSETVLLLALANLGTGFRLESNGRELLDLPPAASIAERVAAIWGDDEAGDLLALDVEAGGVRVTGLVQRPDSVRPAGGRRYLFVNGRPFRDPALLRAVDEAYRTTVVPGLRPTVFLNIGIPAGQVDVNVHPAKAEVRFHDPKAMLGPEPGPAGPEHEPSAGEPGTGAGGISKKARERSAEGMDSGQLAFFVPGLARVTGTPAKGASGTTGPAPANDAGETPADEPWPAHRTPSDIWQLHQAYILVTMREGLLIIDQHSAHERVLFEEIMRRFQGEGGASQRLLFPLTLRLSPAEYAAVEELKGLLQTIGFEVEAFGERTVIVHATPHPHPHFDAEGCFREMVHELAHGSELVNSARNQHERIAKSMACKGAIKAGQSLSRTEMEGLLDRLFATELPGHDVHGRPTILRLTLDELGRRFGRE
jgi:DNA mismatch repair protein MutL